MGAYRSVTFEAAKQRWLNGVAADRQHDLIPPGVLEAWWKANMDADPVGATWGPGVRRAPQTAVWGWTPALAGKTMIPTLLVAGIHDKQVPPQRVQELFADLGSKEKVLLDLGCSSHNAMWERNHLLMFKASLDWLSSGRVNGAKDGVVKLGY